MNKLSAFTLMELLIGMLVSSIVIGMCYFSITAYGKQFLLYKKNKVNLWNIIQFQSVISENCFATNGVSYSNGKLEIDDYKNQKWNYYFYDSLVIREHNSIIDSFYFKIKNVVASDLLNSINYDNNIIEGIEIQTLLAGESYDFFIESNCANESFVKKEILNLNKN